MDYRVEVVIEHEDGKYDSYYEHFDSLNQARSFARGVDDGDPGDTVKIYINDTLWREYKV